MIVLLSLILFSKKIYHKVSLSWNFSLTILFFCLFVSHDTGVRSIKFHPDGRTLFCGLDDGLKVLICLCFLMSCAIFRDLKN